MKTRVGIIFLIVLIIAMAGIGYFGLPILIEKETSELRSDIQDLKQRLQKIEEESKAAPLKPEADVQKVIKIDGLFIKAAEVASDENKKTIKELQDILKKARAEIDTDLPAAINRIDLLWYEMGKLLRKVEV